MVIMIMVFVFGDGCLERTCQEALDRQFRIGFAGRNHTYALHGKTSLEALSGTARDQDIHVIQRVWLPMIKVMYCKLFW